MNARPEGSRDGSPPAGQVRVLVVGDSGVGKTSLVHLIVNGRPILKPMRTVGCSVSVKYMEAGESLTMNAQHGGVEEEASNKRRGFFVELWDISGHEMYKHSRSLFYSKINGVILVHDLSRAKSQRHSAKEWTSELVQLGTFNTPSDSAVGGGLPVPLLVIGNKADIREKDPLVKGRTKLMEVASKSKTLELARAWVEKNRLLKFRGKSELPQYIRSSASSGGLIACAREGRLDLEAVDSFFYELIKRRYFTEVVDALPSHSLSWQSYSGGADGGESSSPGLFESPSQFSDSSDGTARIDIEPQQMVYSPNGGHLITDSNPDSLPGPSSPELPVDSFPPLVLGHSSMHFSAPSANQDPRERRSRSSPPTSSTSTFSHMHQLPPYKFRSLEETGRSDTLPSTGSLPSFTTASAAPNRLPYPFQQPIFNTDIHMFTSSSQGSQSEHTVDNSCSPKLRNFSIWKEGRAYERSLSEPSKAPSNQMGAPSDSQTDKGS